VPTEWRQFVQWQSCRSGNRGAKSARKRRNSSIFLASHVPRLDKPLSALTASALFVFLTLHVTPLRAQTDEQRRQARELAAQGFDALQRKDFAEAEDAFRRADALVHAPTLVLDHARALVGLGRLVEAHEGFAQVLREGVAANAPWQWRSAVDAARAELGAIEPRLAWLTVTVSGPRAPEVKIDSKLLRQAGLGVRLAMDPGTHTIVVRADRFLPVEKVVTLDEGQAAKVELVAEPDPSAAPAPAESKPAPQVIFVNTPEAPKARDNTLATILLTAGGVGLVTGAVTGFLALGARSDLKDRCGGSVCVPLEDAQYSELSGKRDRYRTLGTASGVAFSMGLGAAVGGLALIVFNRDPHSGSTAARRPGPRLTLGAGLGSVSLAGDF
jgi:hypothetical protein